MMDEAVVKIEKMAFGGAGFGHLDGKAIFVPFTAPADEVRVKIRVAKRSYVEGEVVEIVEPSPQRISPVCPVFGRCGGCNWQHISYSDQLISKEDIFAEFLWRSGRVSRERVLPIVPAPAPYGYRSRVQLKVRCVAGKLQMGFYRPGSHIVVDIPDECAIAHPEINRIIGQLRRVIAPFHEADKIPQIDVAVDDEDNAELVIHYVGVSKKEIREYLVQSYDALAVDRLFLQTGRKNTLEKVCGGKELILTYLIPNHSSAENSVARLAFNSGGFSQVNFRQNFAVIEMVCKWAGLTGKEKVLDLYCGNGNFSIPLARNAFKVVGVEEFEPSIAIARNNCTANNVKNALFECAGADAAISRMAAAGERYDVVLLDPPRSGAAEVVKTIPLLKPASIIYVSCDPSTLARDIGILHKLNYEVAKSCPVDMFPQTYHIESVTLLKPGG